ncbi:Acetyltransferase (GNAT) family protein [Aquisphaera giovannonii]|uniref:Acetyltransferase (GNAT) family protein n=1 Tax=Aquisphaera giovannonii TaxID=406548 RepID=A0A5B9WC85_9BACT|nr:GNAT family N-acetyltransferase [Aquisphaera giovannonii]QEH38137.1 Acetyltransferase (GNAT) family protein [Aquisphaera giovannonii]
MSDPLRIEKLRPDHALEGFDCGSEELNRFLIRFALANQRAEAAQTYVAVSGSIVVGYHSLAVAEVAFDDAPDRLRKGLARHPIPIMLLARLAVATSWQGRGLGGGLLKDAMRRTLQAADIAGIRAFAVNAKGEAARAFYEHFGFIASPTDPLHLFLLIKDIRRLAGS